MPIHTQLAQAVVGALWTNVLNANNGRVILGQCETGDPMAMGKWAGATAQPQVEQWFAQVR